MPKKQTSAPPRPVGRPRKYEAGETERLPVVLTREEAGEVKRFLLWLSLREGRRVSTGDGLLMALRESTLFKAFQKDTARSGRG